MIRHLAGIAEIVDDIDTADAVITGDHADLIAIGRAALANPDWPRKVADGRPIAAFEKEMISPTASIENTDRWEQSAARTPIATKPASEQFSVRV